MELALLERGGSVHEYVCATDRRSGLTHRGGVAEIALGAVEHHHAQTADAQLVSDRSADRSGAARHNGYALIHRHSESTKPDDSGHATALAEAVIRLSTQLYACMLTTCS